MAGLFNLEVYTIGPTWEESRYGTELVANWNKPVATKELFKVHAEPVSSVEDNNGTGRVVVVDQYRVICEPGANPDWDSETKLHIEGGYTDMATKRFLSVVGEPGRYAGSILPHLEFICERSSL